MLSKRVKQLHELPLFLQASKITHTPDDVWKKFWQTVNTFTKTLRHGPPRLYQFNKREVWKTDIPDVLSIMFDWVNHFMSV